MFHSILIWGGNDKARDKKALELTKELLGHSPVNHPDFILVEGEKSIQINQVRKLQRQLQFKPYHSKIKVALVSEADLLTLPAQHSLLKTLEEPPANSIIILTAQTKDSLLPTIISRCHLISLSEKPAAVSQEIIAQQQEITQKILSSSPGERVLLAENYAGNQALAKEFCTNQLLFWRGWLRQGKSAQSAQALRLIQTSLRFLKANVNPKLVVVNLLISYPK